MHDHSYKASAEPLSPRKQAIRDLADRWAPRRDSYIDRNTAFHEEDHRYLRFLIPEGLRVLDVGCATGRLLAALKPSRGVGIDLSPQMIEVARSRYPEYEFLVGDIEMMSTLEHLGGPFDVILLADTIGMLEDCQATLERLRHVCHADTRLVISYYNYLWEPPLKVAEWLGFKMPAPLTNWLRPPDIVNLVRLADYEAVREDWRQLLPVRLFGLGPLFNRFIGTLPGIRQFCLRNYLVARPLKLRSESSPSVSIVVPCRNERGNIEPILKRVPDFCEDVEFIFVEGNSQDGTYEEIERLIPLYPERRVKLLKQDGKGKGDAVRKGFQHASGEVLMILDADMTMPPEHLPKFYRAIAEDKGEFVNGSRLVYPMEQDAMRLLNRIANHLFSLVFTWLLNQRFTDTLCGTKVLRRSHYDRIAANRAYFGDFDPFGDFDLIFGGAKMSLKILEVPVPYAARIYGETQISRFRHGWLLLRMVAFAYTKLKAFR